MHNTVDGQLGDVAVYHDTQTLISVENFNCLASNQHAWIASDQLQQPTHHQV